MPSVSEHYSGQLTCFVLRLLRVCGEVLFHCLLSTILPQQASTRALRRPGTFVMELWDHQPHAQAHRATPATTARRALRHVLATMGLGHSAVDHAVRIYFALLV